MRFNPKIIWTIFRKDVVDAIRDGRVAIALVVPIVLAIFYSYSFPDDDEIFEAPRYGVAFFSEQASGLPSSLSVINSGNVILDVETLDSAEQVRAEVADENWDIGLVLPAGFDQAVIAGEQPTLEVVQPPETTTGTVYVLAALEPALRVLGDQPLPAIIETNQTTVTESESLLEQVGFTNMYVLFAVIFLVAMIAMLAIPVILAEEVEKKTLDALVMIASYGDVIVAKALVGVVYSIVGIVITVTLTQISPQNIVAFVGSMAVLTACLMGFGLWMGGLFKSANQLNTWSGVILLPVIAPTFLILIQDPSWLVTLTQLFPVSAGARIATNGLTGEQVFDNVAFSYFVMAVWAVAGYALLFRQLQRRQA